MIDKIKSKYILQYALDYIQDKDVELKLFSYSKYLQKKLDIKIIYYYKKYLDGLGFDLNKYLYKDDDEYGKDILAKEYNHFISEYKLNKEKFENILFRLINSENEGNNRKYINIESPLFEIISKTKYFERNYVIYISQKNIDKYKLKDDYIIIFNKLNNSNVKYSSIYYSFNEDTKLDCLEELNINYNGIKTIHLANTHDELLSIEFLNKIIKILKLFNNLEQLFLIGIGNISYILDNVNLKGIKELNLSLNRISFIRILEKEKFDKLKILNLSWNQLSNIKVIEKLKLDKLDILNLSENIISDIEGLEKAKLIEMKELDLSYNKISDIKMLEKANFKKLKILNLCHNKISDIKALEKVQFDELEILNVSENIIRDINILEKVNFEKLKELYLNSNEISEINILDKVKFDKLEKLLLKYNDIVDIKVLKNANFKKLKYINLSHNKISDIKVLEKLKINTLEKFNLFCNKIDVNKYISIISKLKFQIFI